MIVGCARVSSVDQNERRQLDALKKSAAERIYIDKQSGKNFDRPAYQQMIEILEENDENLTKYFEKSQNILDIIEFLWENIVLEVPIRVTNTTGVHLKGQGWELNSEKKDDGLDPRFEKLNELFKGGE